MTFAPALLAFGSPPGRRRRNVAFEPERVSERVVGVGGEPRGMSVSARERSPPMRERTRRRTRLPDAPRGYRRPREAAGGTSNVTERFFCFSPSGATVKASPSAKSPSSRRGRSSSPETPTASATRRPSTLPGAVGAGSVGRRGAKRSTTSDFVMLAASFASGAGSGAPFPGPGFFFSEAPTPPSLQAHERVASASSLERASFFAPPSSRPCCSFPPLG